MVILQGMRSWSASKDRSTHFLLFASIALALSSLIAIVFKSVSVHSWYHPHGTYYGPGFSGEGSWHFKLDLGPYLAQPGTDFHLPGQHLDLVNAPLVGVKYNTVLVYVAACYALSTALFMAYAAVTMSSINEIHIPVFRGALVYLIYHLTWAVSLIAFVYLTVQHNRSVSYTTDSLEKSWSASDEIKAPCVGLCYDQPSGSYGFVTAEAGDKIDLSTWTCGLNSRGNVEDPTHALRNMCLGEVGSRVMMMVIAGFGMVIALFLEVHRRKSRAAVTHTKEEHSEMEKASNEDAAVLGSANV